VASDFIVKNKPVEINNTGNNGLPSNVGEIDLEDDSGLVFVDPKAEFKAKIEKDLQNQ